MQFLNALLSLGFLATFVAAQFDASSSDNIALYWGQNSIGQLTNQKVKEQNLTYYCENDDVDIVLLSFLNKFPGTNGIPTLTFNGYEFSSKYTDELTVLADQIETCQNKDKLVLLSLGGEGEGYGFTKDSEGTNFANTLWDMFGPKNASTNSSALRPFGDVVVDGFDLDAENKNETGYVNLLYTLKQKIDKNSGGKKIYLSVAPQCPSNENNLSNVLDSNYFDFAFIQFYNNAQNCDANTDNFNWDWWSNWAANSSRNNDIKIYLGVPGSADAAASGYFNTTDLLKEKVKKAAQSSNFGGISIFDASTAFNNNATDDGNYVEVVRDALDNSNTSSSSTSGSSSSSHGSGSVVGVSFSVLSAMMFGLFTLF